MSATERLSDRIGVPVSDSDTESSVEPSLSTDDVFHLLQSQRRRAVIRYLRDREQPVEMRDIAEQVAAWEQDKSVQALTSNERQRAYIPLYQSHLPKLDEEGVIDYDQSRGTVRKTPLATQLERLLDADDEPVDEADDHPWNSYYLGVSCFGTLLFLGASLDIPLFTLVPGVTVITLVLTSFWIVSIYHTISR